MGYDAGPVTSPVEAKLRRLILALLTFGFVALGAELLAIGHYEDSWQLVPLGLIGGTLLVIAWHAVAGGARSLLALQILLILIIAGGAMGIFLHYQTNVDFQLDTNPDVRGWALFARALHAIAPPALAPGVMAQLGFLGLIYTYKHPGRRSPRDG